MKRVVTFRTSESASCEFIKLNGVLECIERIPVKAPNTVEKWIQQLRRHVDAFVVCDTSLELGERMHSTAIPDTSAFIANGEGLRRVLERRAIYAAWKQGWIAPDSQACLLGESDHSAALDEFSQAGVSIVRGAGGVLDADGLVSAADVVIAPIERALNCDIYGRLLICDSATAAQIAQLTEQGLAQLIVLAAPLDGVNASIAEMEALLALAFGKLPLELIESEWSYILDVMQLEQSVLVLNERAREPDDVAATELGGTQTQFNDVAPATEPAASADGWRDDTAPGLDTYAEGYAYVDAEATTSTADAETGAAANLAEDTPSAPRDEVRNRYAKDGYARHDSGKLAQAANEAHSRPATDAANGTLKKVRLVRAAEYEPGKNATAERAGLAAEAANWSRRGGYAPAAEDTDQPGVLDAQGEALAGESYYGQAGEVQYADEYEQPGEAYDAGEYEQPDEAYDAGEYEQPDEAYDAGEYEQPDEAYDAGGYEQPGEAYDAGEYEQLDTQSTPEDYVQPNVTARGYSPAATQVVNIAIAASMPDSSPAMESAPLPIATAASSAELEPAPESDEDWIEREERKWREQQAARQVEEAAALAARLNAQATPRPMFSVSTRRNPILDDAQPPRLRPAPAPDPAHNADS